MTSFIGVGTERQRTSANVNEQQRSTGAGIATNDGGVDVRRRSLAFVVVRYPASAACAAASFATGTRNGLQLT